MGRMAVKKKASWGGPREGAGRPQVLDDPVDRWIRLERPDAEAAEELARKRGISFAALIRRALRMYLNRQKRS